jgi:hypothetical protein
MLGKRSASKIGDCHDAVHVLHKDQARNREPRGQGDGKASVAVEEGVAAAVPLHPLRSSFIYLFTLLFIHFYSFCAKVVFILFLFCF